MGFVPERASLRGAALRRHPPHASSSTAERDEAERINEDFREYLDRLRVLRREKDGGMEGLLMAMATGYDYRKYQRVKGGEFEGEGEARRSRIGEGELDEDELDDDEESLEDRGLSDRRMSASTIERRSASPAAASARIPIAKGCARRRIA